MSSESQKYILIGPHKGKTLAVNGHEFVDGEFTFHGSHEQIATLTRIFDNYAALPEHMVELQELRAKQSVVTSESVEKVKEVAVTTGADSAEALRQALGEDNPAGQAVVNLGEAIGKLDPEVDAHWTSNNLPSLDHLAELLGKKVARGEVDSVAEGYTRAKARTARSQ